jgi:hypothetical protein
LVFIHNIKQYFEYFNILWGKNVLFNHLMSIFIGENSFYETWHARRRGRCQIRKARDFRTARLLTASRPNATVFKNRATQFRLWFLSKCGSSEGLSSSMLLTSIFFYAMNEQAAQPAQSIKK